MITYQCPEDTFTCCHNCCSSGNIKVTAKEHKTSCQAIFVIKNTNKANYNVLSLKLVTINALIKPLALKNWPSWPQALSKSTKSR